MRVLDEGTLFHVAQSCATDTEAQIAALENYWIDWAGPPKELYVDPATGYTTERFLGKIQEYGIQVKVSARDSHWQFGRTEIHGSILQRMLKKWTKKCPLMMLDLLRVVLFKPVWLRTHCQG